MAATRSTSGRRRSSNQPRLRAMPGISSNQRRTPTSCVRLDSCKRAAVLWPHTTQVSPARVEARIREAVGTSSAVRDAKHMEAVVHRGREYQRCIERVVLDSPDAASGTDRHERIARRSNVEYAQTLIVAVHIHRINRIESNQCRGSLEYLPTAIRCSLCRLLSIVVTPMS